jgi:chaperone required for assembly of F1-ATPase
MLTRGKPQPPDRPKRFYKEASPGPVDGGFGVLLDGRPVRTPAGARLALPTPALGELLAEEWAAQKDVIVLAQMPATRLAFTTADRAADAREALADSVAAYAGSDLLAYFAEGPESLLERQLSHWGPVLAWAEADLDLHFTRAVGVIHQPQPAATTGRVKALALALDDYRLTGLAHAAALFGSAILALALQRGELSGQAAFDLSRLDEAFQEERWGVDEEAAVRAAAMRAEALMLERWFKAL